MTKALPVAANNREVILRSKCERSPWVRDLPDVSRSYLDASGILDRWKQATCVFDPTLIAIAYDFKVAGCRIIESSELKRSPSFAAMQRYVQFRGQSGSSAGMLETTLLTR